MLKWFLRTALLLAAAAGFLGVFLKMRQHEEKKYVELYNDEDDWLAL